MNNLTTLKGIGEDAAIDVLLSVLGKSQGALVGPGDDCAVVAVDGASEDWLLTSDPVIEGIHFQPDTEPRLIGRKAVGRVLSDIAAMGGDPRWLLVNVTAPPQYRVERLKAVYKGARSLCKKYGAEIIGGDVGQGPALSIHVFGVGCVPQGSAIQRRGTSAGDAIYVTGRLGGSYAGKHLTFEPRITEALWLREQGWPKTMLDVSDGLASDLRRLMRLNKVGAQLYEAAIPISSAARAMRDDKTPLYHALTDGEDFELLFTIAADQQTAFETSWKDVFRLPCTCIGRMTAKAGNLTMLDANGKSRVWRSRGYEHFVS